MTVELDGRQMTSRFAAHDHLKQQLELPDYYGRNLDALYDLLTERGTPTKIILNNWGEMPLGLGDYAYSLLKTLYQAVENNPALELEVK